MFIQVNILPKESQQQQCKQIFLVLDARRNKKTTVRGN